MDQDHSSPVAELSLMEEKIHPVTGLHAGVLGHFETLAQSVSAMAPSTSACLTIPIVFALAGNATWFVYLLATCATLIIGFCISRFARLSASPGSLYTYTIDTLPRGFGVAAGFGLLLAYLATGVSVAGGALYYTNLLTLRFLHFSPPPLLALLFVCSAGGYIAWRDVKLSAELMLWIEICSLGLIVVVLAVMLVRDGFRMDMDQFRLKGVALSALGPALVLSMFSFVGFESATTLGGEVHNPLHTIPRTVIQCAIIAGVFFVFCSYSEVLGFRGTSNKLSDTSSPLHLLAARAGISPLGTGIDLGAFVSMAACVLACVTAASRVLMRMAEDRLAPAVFKRAGRHGTPTAGIILSTGAIFVAAAAMTIGNISGSDIYDLAGSLAVFGFLTAYALACIALPFARRARRHYSKGIAAISILAVIVIALIAVFDLRSTADLAHALLPYIFAIYIGAGLAWYAFSRMRTRVLP